MKISALTSYSFLFILFIFFHHLGAFPGGGTLGVTLFLILGGIKMNMGYSERIDNPNFNYGRYLKRRLLKFFPVHWLTLALSILIALPVVFSADYCFRLFLNASLLHGWVPIRRFYLSFNGVSWYLSCIVFFTMLFPWLFRTIKRDRKAIVIPFLIVYLVLVLLLPKEWYHPILYVNPLVRAGEFCLGLLIGEWVKTMRQRGATQVWCQNHKLLLVAIEAISLLLLLGVAYKYGGGTTGLISAIYWLPAASFFIVVSLRESVLSLSHVKVLDWFGTLTFSFYMSHALCIKFFNPLLKEVGLGDVTRAAGILMISIIVASLIHYCFEKPINILSSKI